MGKKQKMKKAAAAAKAAAATDAALGMHEVAATDNNNKSSENNKKSALKADARDMRSNIQKLMKLAKDLETKEEKAKAKAAAASSGSGSSATDSCDSDDDATVMQDEQDNELEATVAAIGGAASAGRDEFVPISKCSRGEKKARRLLMKLDLEPMQNVSRVTMRKAKNVLLFIDHPEVFKCPNTKTLICFGEVRIEDTSNAAAAQAAERYLNDSSIRSHSPSKDVDQLSAAKQLQEDDDEVVDDSKLDEKDIELVQMQAECSRQKAVKALIKHNSDVVNAIMDLTVG